MRGSGPNSVVPFAFQKNLCCVFFFQMRSSSFKKAVKTSKTASFYICIKNYYTGRELDLICLLHMEDISQQSTVKSTIWLGIILSNFRNS